MYKFKGDEKRIYIFQAIYNYERIREGSFPTEQQAKEFIDTNRHKV